MLAVFFEILAVVFGTAALATSLKLNPHVKISKLMISSFYESKRGATCFKILMALFYCFNTLAFYLYVGPVSLIFAAGLLSVITKPVAKTHLFTSFLVLIFYGLVNVTYNPRIYINYVPIVISLYVILTYFKTRSNAVGSVLLILTSAILMLVNILVVS